MSTPEVSAERLDHHGIVAGIIKDIGLIEAVDEKIGTNGCEEITHGQALAGMIINGLGFSDRPLSLTPQFFTQLPVEQLFGVGVGAENFNRHKLGRALDNFFGSRHNIFSGSL